MTDRISFVPGPETAREFRDALGSFATGVTVVTITHDGAPMGMTANSFASVSLQPPLVLWSPGKHSRRHDQFARSTRFNIHVLGEEQYELSQRFSRGGAAFDGLDWAGDDWGLPAIQGPLALFHCRAEAAHDAGDHTVVIGRVERAVLRSGRPLCFAHGAFGRFAPFAADQDD